MQAAKAAFDGSNSCLIMCGVLARSTACSHARSLADTSACLQIRNHTSLPNEYPLPLSMSVTLFSHLLFHLILLPWMCPWCAHQFFLRVVWTPLPAFFTLQGYNVEGVHLVSCEVAQTPIADVFFPLPSLRCPRVLGTVAEGTQFEQRKVLLIG